ncbi:unnamed protein product [Mytilus coruscus]|uniref:Uncharacterized protein n=1 Tax=Mytilus coruscus TaxID=42192 RepID=A0A6J8EQC3_MYTCO|nr:unnamed protein product [Mytilus coruscus]
MFGRNPKLPIDFLLGTNQTDETHESLDEWIVARQNRLRYGYEKAGEQTKDRAEYRKTVHDQKRFNPEICVGDKVYIRNRGVHGRNNIQDTWSSTVYRVVRLSENIVTVEPNDGAGVSITLNRQDVIKCNIQPSVDQNNIDSDSSDDTSNICNDVHSIIKQNTTVKENQTIRLISDVKSEVGQVKSDLSITNTEVKLLREDHNELERGVGHLESQFNCLETEKLEALKIDIDEKLASLKECQVLLEKHDRKYNILIYGIEQKQNEIIWEVIDILFVKDLGIEKFKADSFLIANAHRIPAKAPVVGTKRPDAIIVRFMHYADKQCIMAQAYKVANKKIRIVDDLPVIMKEARNDLAKIAYNIRTKEKLQTRIRARGVHLVLETRLNARDVWNVRKDISCV